MEKPCTSSSLQSGIPAVISPLHLEIEHHIAGEAGHIPNLSLSKTISTGQALELHQVLMENTELHDNSRAVRKMALIQDSIFLLHLLRQRVLRYNVSM